MASRSPLDCCGRRGAAYSRRLGLHAALGPYRERGVSSKPTEHGAGCCYSDGAFRVPLPPFVTPRHPRDSWIPVPFPAPVASLPNFRRPFSDRETPNCRSHSRRRRGGSLPERYGKSLSERRSLSQARALADLFCKLFSVLPQRLILVVMPESRYPFRLLPLSISYSEPALAPSHWGCRPIVERDEKFAIGSCWPGRTENVRRAPGKGTGARSPGLPQEQSASRELVPVHRKRSRYCAHLSAAPVARSARESHCR
jgi:hypothetical protein